MKSSLKQTGIMLATQGGRVLKHLPAGRQVPDSTLTSGAGRVMAA